VSYIYEKLLSIEFGVVFVDEMLTEFLFGCFSELGGHRLIRWVDHRLQECLGFIDVVEECGRFDEQQLTEELGLLLLLLGMQH
jgi:hypothetical protein